MRASLPSADVSVPSMPIIQEVVKSQEETSLTMARHLEGLAAHYGQMAEALRDNEAGEEIGEEDVQGVYPVVVCQAPRLKADIFDSDDARRGRAPVYHRGARGGR